MKILKIFGVVVGVHVLALILIFASPGCSSANKPTNVPSETVIQRDNGAGDASAGPAASTASNASPVSAAPFDPNAPAVAFDPNATAAPIRFAPTRPGTPAAGALEAQPVSDVTPGTTYVVAKGDSLWTIAKKNHITVAELAAANNLKAASTVRVGQKLFVPSKSMPTVNHAEPVAVTKAPASDIKPAPRASGESVKHVVKSGETLGVIARKYQVSVGEIATANNISDPKKIRAGMELVIPGWQAPSGKKSGTAKAPSTPSSTANPAVATPPAQTPAANVPTLVIPPPGQDLDAGLQNKNDDAPVIKVDDK